MSAQRIRHPAPRMVLTIAAALTIHVQSSLAGTPDSFIGPDQGLWSNPANWDLNLVPNNNSQSFDVFLNSPTPTTCLLDQTATVDTLTVTSSNALSIQGLKKLTFAGSLLDNAGSLSLFSALLDFQVNTTISGTGTILLTGSNSNMTGANGRIVTTDNLITGQGTLGFGLLKFINSGTIAATTGVLTISPQNATDGFLNSGVLRADGSTLVLSGSVLNNAGGLIEARNGSTVSLKFGTLTGGSVIGGTTGTVGFSTSVSLQNVTLAGNIVTNAAATSTLTLAGAVTNTGAWTFNSPVTISPTGATINNKGSLVLTAAPLTFTSLTLTGAGKILCVPSSSISATSFASDNLLTGAGSVSLSGACVNSGTISASTDLLTLAQGLTFSSSNSLLNSGLLEARGGTLSLYSGTFTNNGTIQAADGSLLVTSNDRWATLVTGGTIQALSGGTVVLKGYVQPDLLRSEPSGIISIDNWGTQKLPSPYFDAGAFISKLDNAGTLILQPHSEVFPLPGTTLSNSGTILLTNLAFLPVEPGTLNLTGGGTFDLGTSNNYIATPLNGKPASLVSDNLITGSGNIGLSSNPPMTLINNGTISAPLVPNRQLAIQTAAGPNGLINNGTLRADGGTLSLNGGDITNNGTIVSLASGIVIINVNVSGGTLQANNANIAVGATAQTVSINSFLLSADSANNLTATLDLASSKLILQSTSPSEKQSKLPPLIAALHSGSNAGTWTGKGLTSSTAAADPSHYALALLDNADLQLPSFGGQPVDQNSLLVSIAHLGDANDNGIIDIQDQSIITNHWQSAQSTWSSGDLNLDGFVDLQDLTIVTNNWQQSTTNSQLPFTNYQLPSIPIPEPASLLLLFPAMLLLARQRRFSP